MELCYNNGQPIDSLPTQANLSKAVYNHRKYGGTLPFKLRIGADAFIEVDDECEEFACKVVATFKTAFPPEGKTSLA